MRLSRETLSQAQYTERGFTKIHAHSSRLKHITELRLTINLNLTPWTGVSTQVIQIINVIYGLSFHPEKNI